MIKKIIRAFQAIRYNEAYLRSHKSQEKSKWKNYILIFALLLVPPIFFHLFKLIYTIGKFIIGLILNDNKGQTYRKWSQAFINYSIKQDGILPKPPIDDEISVLFHHHHKIGEGKYLVSQHHLVLKSNIDNIYTLFVDSRTGQSFLEYKVSFGTGEPKSKLSTWRETTLGICEITPEKN